MITKLAISGTSSSNTLSDALATRVNRALKRVTEDIDERVAADAVSAPSDALVLLRLLEEPSVLELLRADDPLAPARLRGLEAKAKLADLAGGLLSAAEAAAALGITRQGIEKRRRAGRLLAVSLGRRGYRYPAFQFADGEALPGLDRVLPALQGRDPWTQLSFLVNARTELSGKSPVAWLQSARGPIGDAVESVVQAAMADLDQGAA
jgi:hypothetical protein